MKSQVLFTALTLFTSMVTAQTKVGCYNSTLGLKFDSTDTYNSIGYCSRACPRNRAFAMIYMDCYCGDEIPPDSLKLKDSECETPCPGYDVDSCGSKFSNATTVYKAAGVSNVPKAEAPQSSSTSSTPSSTATSKPTLTTLPEGQTVTITPSNSASSESSGKSNVAGIAAGVVVGVLAILGIAGGAFLVMRRRKRRAIEEEHQRNAAVKNFIANKPPMSAGSSSFNDSRLDPVIASRRMSDGSIADNQDYSRRILKVTNA
jgi:cell wall integrity and stress response component